MRKDSILQQYYYKKLPKFQNAGQYNELFARPTPNYSSDAQLVNKMKADEVQRVMAERRKAQSERTFIGQGKPTTPESEERRKRLNQQYAATHPYASIDEQGNLSRRFYDRSMETQLGDKNTTAAGIDKGLTHAQNAMDAAGLVMGVGALTGAGYNATKAALAESMESGFLSKAHTLNPFAGTFAGESKLPSFLQFNKLDDLNAFWRLTKDPKNFGLAEGAYFNKGVPLTGDLANTFPKGSRAWTHRYSGLVYNPETKLMDRYAGPDYLFKVGDESFMKPHLNFPEPHLKFYRQSGNIPEGESQLFRKDWLRGWTKEVPKPKFISSEPVITRGPINYWEEPGFAARNPNFKHESYVNSVNKFGNTSGDIPPDLMPYINTPPKQSAIMGDIKQMFTKPNQYFRKPGTWGYDPIEESISREWWANNRGNIDPFGETGPIPIPKYTPGALDWNKIGRTAAGVGAATGLMSLGLGLKKQKQGGLIEDDRGQWAHPGENTRISSPSITMKGVPYPVLGRANTGQQMMMQPGQDYYFQGAEYVDEYPLVKYQNRGEVTYTHQPADLTNIGEQDSYIPKVGPLQSYNVLGEHYMLKRTVTPYTRKRDIKRYTQQPTDPRQVNFISNYAGATGEPLSKGFQYPTSVPYEGKKHWNIDRFIIDPQFKKGFSGFTDGSNHHEVMAGNTVDEMKANTLADMYKYYMLQNDGKRDKSFRQAKRFMRREINPRIKGSYFNEFMMADETPTLSKDIDTYADTNPLKGLYANYYTSHPLMQYNRDEWTPEKVKRISMDYLRNIRKMKKKDAKDLWNKWENENKLEGEEGIKMYEELFKNNPELAKNIDYLKDYNLSQIKAGTYYNDINTRKNKSFNLRRENRKLDRQTRKGIKNQLDCWGANCYENEVPIAQEGIITAEYGGPLVDYYKGKMTGPNIFANGGAVSLNAIIRQNREDRDNNHYSGGISKYEKGGQSNEFYYNKGYGVPHFAWGGPTRMNEFGYLVDKLAGGGEWHHGYYDEDGGLVKYQIRGEVLGADSRNVRAATTEFGKDRKCGITSANDRAYRAEAKQMAKEDKEIERAYQAEQEAIAKQKAQEWADYTNTGLDPYGEKYGKKDKTFMENYNRFISANPSFAQEQSTLGLSPEQRYAMLYKMAGRSGSPTFAATNRLKSYMGIDPSQRFTDQQLYETVGKMGGIDKYADWWKGGWQEIPKQRYGGDTSIPQLPDLQGPLLQYYYSKGGKR